MVDWLYSFLLFCKSGLLGEINAGAPEVRRRGDSRETRGFRTLVLVNHQQEAENLQFEFPNHKALSVCSSHVVNLYGNKVPSDSSWPYLLKKRGITDILD
ncbi:uncharacterized protein LOC116197338 isoform X2 [Punica granatum]|uniref:Uncharacterized protein LOC116197338 isoform X2 n=1 Tax=Punica granatum TaxID=22663 RepID=A0A6P8CJA2_PUNGR|nr:uncharacterized protein LOC116197338 isoform X2 [Punica granatum]